jgi:hypothetical protein
MKQALVGRCAKIIDLELISGFLGAPPLAAGTGCRQRPNRLTAALETALISKVHSAYTLPSLDQKNQFPSSLNCSNISQAPPDTLSPR